MEAFIETMFKSPAFKSNMQLWFTEALSGAELGPTQEEVERIVKDIIENDVQIEVSFR